MRPACEAALQVARVGLESEPPVPVPGPLRRLVRFSRLSDHAVATVRRVLDEDEAFRSRVATSLELAGTAGELDEPSLVFLTRPAGWEESLAVHAAAASQQRAAEATTRADAVSARRLVAVEASLARTEAELSARRVEVSDLRAQVAAERRLRRTAESDLGRARKRVALLEAAAERHQPPVGADVPAAQLEALGQAVAAAEARVATEAARADRERDRADAAEDALLALEAATAVRPQVVAPSVPVVDHHAVEAAITTAVTAAGTLADALARAARELAHAAPAAEPCPTTSTADRPGPPTSARPAASGPRTPARTPVALPPATFEDTPEAAEHLLRVPGVRVLVDGYNVTLTSRGGLSLADQRRWLLDAVSGVAARTGAAFDVFFDGDEEASAPADRSRRMGVQVRFTAAGVEADDVLLEMLAGLPPGRPVVVVSDDRRVREGARLGGGNVVGVAALVETFRR